MERKDKGEKKEGEIWMGKRELKGGMLLQVGKRGGPSTPSPTWRVELSSPNDSHGNPIQEFLDTTTAVSARKLCASFWEIQPQVHHSAPKMNKSLGHRRAHPSHQYKDKTASALRTHLVDPLRAPLDQSLPGTISRSSLRAKFLATCFGSLNIRGAYTQQICPVVMWLEVKYLPFSDDITNVRPARASPLRKHAASSTQRHRSTGRDGNALQPMSPARCDSPMEVAPYNPAVTPNCSSDFKGRIGESSYSLKTSTELLKLLNRIWSLEEQPASNMSLLRALKMELDHSQSQIEELLKEKQADRQEMDNLMKQLAEDKVVRKIKEQDRIKYAVQSVQEELEDEKKLRKRSESLHRKLARELSEVKYSFSNALKELERERKACFLLENLCDEFAKGIRDYEQEVRSLRHNPDMDSVGREKPDRLVLHISEAWLDERMQMKLAEAESDPVEKNTIVDKLGLDIEAFLQARLSIELKNDSSFAKERIRKSSRRESFPLNDDASAPRAAADEDSTDSDSRCFEPNKSSSKRQTTCNSKQVDNASETHLEKILFSNSKKRMAGSGENTKVHNPVNYQAQFEEHSAGNKTRFPDRGQNELRGESQVLSNIYEAKQDGQHERKSKQMGAHGLNSNYMLDTLTRHHSFSYEGEKSHPVSDFKKDGCAQPVFVGHASPVQQWMSKLKSPEFEKSESYLKLTRVLKENTLEAKLLEARLEGQKSRLRASKANF
uniref:Uncharacterized protein n=1 Tax=Salix viminalis TaxID=40686 RepID=A0A6N2N2E8_SALVM